MKHYYLKALTLLSCLIFGITAHAYDFEAQNGDDRTIYYNITSSRTCEVTYSKKGTEDYSYSTSEYNSHITIPETVTYNGTTYSVTSIGNYAFYNCRSLTSVTIPNSVTSIGKSAFYYCDGLTSIEIPNNVSSIGEVAFERCSGLSSIVVDSGNSVYDSRNNCNAIIETKSKTLILGCKNTIIPNSVLFIGSDAFRYCYGLTSITIPNSVTSIGERAFYKCTGLTNVTIGNGVTDIGKSAFTDCTGLANVIFGNSVRSIGYYAFNDCSSLTNIIIPNSVTSVEADAFTDCTGLANVIIGNGVTSIRSGVFSGCTGLTSVTIPNSVTSIGSYAFSKCTGLTNITIGNSVTSIDDYAFSGGCGNLTSISSLNPNPPYCGKDVFKGIDYKNVKLKVPQESLNLYLTANTWGDFWNIIDVDFSGIEETFADDAEGSEYYNLQGVRVENPERGVYIKRQGGKTTKVIL